MKNRSGISMLLAITLLIPVEDVFGRGFGGRGGGGGGGGFHAGGGGAARPSFSGGGGGAHPSFGGGGARPSLGEGGGTHPNLGGGGGGGGARPNFGGMANHTPSFSHPTGGGSSRPNFGVGNRPEIGGGGVRPGAGGSGERNPILAGGGNRPGAGGSGERNPFIAGGGVRPGAGGSGECNPIVSGGGVRPGAGGSGERNPFIAGGGVRPGAGGSGTRNPTIAGGVNRPGGIGNNTNLGNINNIGHIGNNNFNNIHNNNFNNNNFTNVHNNINIASNRSYYNNWQHGNWNGNWNRPGAWGAGTQWNGGGNGYWSGWAHGYNRSHWNGGWGGYWNGGGGGYWGRPWYASPITWGLGAWAVGSLMYTSGYSNYSNPYYSGSSAGPAYYDYSQPITVINQQPAVVATTALAGTDSTIAEANANPPSPEVQEGTSHMDLARDAFQKGDYATASAEIDLAIKTLPNDAVLHEFRVLVFFATKDYKQAAATLYAVLSAGPGWDWTTLSGMYASVDTYTAQLRALEEFVKANPSAADARFVLAYEYLTCGYTDAARKQYEDVIKLQPGDQLSAQLLKLAAGDSTETASTTETAAKDPTPQPPEAGISTAQNEPSSPTPVEAEKLVGKWTARRDDGSTFGLNLTPDSKFTWSFEQAGKKQDFGGKYSVDGAVLVLERTDGAQMPGLVTLTDNGFKFRLYGGPPDDQGLNFMK